MKIEVFGSGCSRCVQTYDKIKSVLNKENIEAEIVKIEDINEILNRGVVMTPAVYIDNEKKIAGKIPDEKTILSWFKN